VRRLPDNEINSRATAAAAAAAAAAATARMPLTLLAP